MLILGLSVLSCKKNELQINNSSTINVINAGVNAGSLKVNQGAGAQFTWSKTGDIIAYVLFGV